MSHIVFLYFYNFFFKSENHWLGFQTTQNAQIWVVGLRKWQIRYAWVETIFDQNSAVSKIWKGDTEWQKIQNCLFSSYLTRIKIYTPCLKNPPRVRMHHILGNEVIDQATWKDYHFPEITPSPLPTLYRLPLASYLYKIFDPSIMANIFWDSNCRTHETQSFVHFLLSFSCHKN